MTRAAGSVLPSPELGLVLPESPETPVIQLRDRLAADGIYPMNMRVRSIPVMRVPLTPGFAPAPSSPRTDGMWPPAVDVPTRDGKMRLRPHDLMELKNAHNWHVRHAIGAAVVGLVGFCVLVVASIVLDRSGAYESSMTATKWAVGSLGMGLLGVAAIFPPARRRSRTEKVLRLIQSR